MCMDKDLIGYGFFQIIYYFNKSKITPIKFYSILLNKIHQFYYKRVRYCVQIMIK